MSTPMDDENPGLPLWDFLNLVQQAEIAHEQGNVEAVEQINARLATIRYRVTWCDNVLKIECELESDDGQR